MPKKDPQLPGFDRAETSFGRGVANPDVRGNRGAGHKWRCHQCGELQKYWTRAQRHADENQHYRIEVILSVEGVGA